MGSPKADDYVAGPSDGKASGSGWTGWSRRQGARGSAALVADHASVVKEGWMLKRGEFIRNWRKRYYRLMSDGMLIGFKTLPETGEDVRPDNCFRCTEGITISDESKMRKNAFAATVISISFQAKTVLVTRYFCVDTTEECESWKRAIMEVACKVDEGGDDAGDTDLDEKRNAVEHGSITIDDFMLIKTLGQGAFGKVLLAKHKKTAEVYALKILKKKVIVEQNEVEHIASERNVLQKTDHPFLASLKDSFETTDVLCFVMEYIQGGEIFFHLQRAKYFSVDLTRFYSAEILDALHYLHACGIIYRDLKLENVMLAHDGHVKITDFGLCKEEIKFGDDISTFCGTPEYFAPEVLEEDVYDRCVDFWALGIAIYMMSVGRFPYYSKSKDTLFSMIVHAPLCFPENMDPWLEMLLEGLLEKNPKKRLGHGAEGAKEIKRHVFFANIDFQKLRRKEIPPPFVPDLNEMTSNFDRMCTGHPARISLEHVDDSDFPDFDNFSYTDDVSIY